jgi:hypothetical protein
MGRFAQWLRFGGLIRLLGEVPKYADPAEKKLIQIGEPAVEALSRAATGSKSGDVRARAVRALDKIGGATTLPALLQALHDPTEEVAKKAVWALEKFRSARVSDALAEVLRSSIVGSSAAQELARRGDARSLDLLIASNDVSGLEYFLARYAERASNDQLRRCIKVNKTLYIEEDIPGSDFDSYRWGGSDSYRVVAQSVDTTQLKQLARQQLTRRGLKE